MFKLISIRHLYQQIALNAYNCSLPHLGQVLFGSRAFKQRADIRTVKEPTDRSIDNPHRHLKFIFNPSSAPVLTFTLGLSANQFDLF